MTGRKNIERISVYYRVIARAIGVKAMRLIIMFVTAVIFANSSWADTAAYEAAARKVQKITFGIDKPRMLQAFSSSMGQNYSPEDKGILLEIIESSELEAIYVRNLMKVFSESELIALAEMMDSTAYRIYTERIPTFMQGLMPEAAAYWRKSIPEFQRRAAERRRLSGGNGQ